MTIANPTVLIAIWHWYQILRHRSGLTFKDAWDDHEVSKGETFKDIRQLFSSGRPESAKKNLARIGETIIDAARETSVSREAALVALVQHKKYDQKSTRLYEAFLWLRADKTRNDEEKLTKLKEALRKALVSNQSISVERVMDFLTSEKGSRYIRPKRWDAMCNAFIAWHYGLSQDAVVKYRSKARTSESEIDNEMDTRYLLLPRYNQYQLSTVGELLLRQALALPDEAYQREGEGDEDPTRAVMGAGSMDKVL